MTKTQIKQARPDIDWKLNSSALYNPYLHDFELEAKLGLKLGGLVYETRVRRYQHGGYYVDMSIEGTQVSKQKCIDQTAAAMAALEPHFGPLAPSKKAMEFAENKKHHIRPVGAKSKLLVVKPGRGVMRFDYAGGRTLGENKHGNKAKVYMFYYRKKLDNEPKGCTINIDIDNETL